MVSEAYVVRWRGKLYKLCTDDIEASERGTPKYWCFAPTCDIDYESTDFKELMAALDLIDSIGDYAGMTLPEIIEKMFNEPQ